MLSSPIAADILLWHLFLHWKCIIGFCGFAICCAGLFWNAVKARRYCSAPWCNPWYLVCSLRLPRWKVEPGVDLLLREGLALKSGAGQTHREDILKFLFPLPHVHRSSPRPPSPPRRKQLASVIRRCTYFHHFYLLFVCLFFHRDRSLVSSCHGAVNHNYISSRCKELEREKEGEMAWEGPYVYHCRELNSRWRDNEENKQTIMQK